MVDHFDHITLKCKGVVNITNHCAIEIGIQELLLKLCMGASLSAFG